MHRKASNSATHYTLHPFFIHCSGAGYRTCSCAGVAEQKKPKWPARSRIPSPPCRASSTYAPRSPADWCRSVPNSCWRRNWSTMPSSRSKTSPVMYGWVNRCARPLRQVTLTALNRYSRQFLITFKVQTRGNGFQFCLSDLNAEIVTNDLAKFCRRFNDACH